jgi:MFS family permease
VLVLLVLSVAINYLDRGILAVSAPLLQRELTLSPAQLGLLFSSFFWSYSVFQLAAGWLVDRYDVKHVLGAGFLLWFGYASVGWITGLAGCWSHASFWELVRGRLSRLLQNPARVFRSIAAASLMRWWTPGPKSGRR